MQNLAILNRQLSALHCSYLLKGSSVISMAAASTFQFGMLAYLDNFKQISLYNSALIAVSTLTLCCYLLSDLMFRRNANNYNSHPHLQWLSGYLNRRSSPLLNDILEAILLFTLAQQIVNIKVIGTITTTMSSLNESYAKMFTVAAVINIALCGIVVEKMLGLQANIEESKLQINNIAVAV